MKHRLLFTLLQKYATFQAEVPIPIDGTSNNSSMQVTLNGTSASIIQCFGSSSIKSQQITAARQQFKRIQQLSFGVYK
jgi:hypothetical protein